MYTRSLTQILKLKWKSALLSFLAWDKWYDYEICMQFEAFLLKQNTFAVLTTFKKWLINPKWNGRKIEHKTKTISLKPKQFIGWNRCLWVCSVVVHFSCSYLHSQEHSQGELLPDGFTKARKNSINLNFSDGWNFSSDSDFGLCLHLMNIIFLSVLFVAQKIWIQSKCSSSCSLTICFEFIRFVSFHYSEKIVNAQTHH